MKMTDIMKKSHSESKSENLDAILQKIDNKAFITNSADSAHTETKPQPIKLRRKSVGIAAAAACAAIAVGAFAFSGLLKPDIDATTPCPLNSLHRYHNTAAPDPTAYHSAGSYQQDLCRSRKAYRTGRRHARKT